MQSARPGPGGRDARRNRSILGLSGGRCSRQQQHEKNESHPLKQTLKWYFQSSALPALNSKEAQCQPLTYFHGMYLLRPRFQLNTTQTTYLENFLAPFTSDVDFSPLDRSPPWKNSTLQEESTWTRQQSKNISWQKRLLLFVRPRCRLTRDAENHQILAEPRPHSKATTEPTKSTVPDTLVWFFSAPAAQHTKRKRLTHFPCSRISRGLFHYFGGAPRLRDKPWIFSVPRHKSLVW